MRALFAFAISRQILPLIVAVGALTAFALGYLAAFSALFDFFAQFTAHWLVLAVAAVAASFIPRRAYALLALKLPLVLLFPMVLVAWYSAAPAARPTANTMTPGAAKIVEPATGTTGMSAGEDRNQFKLLAFNSYNYNSDLEAVWSEVQRHDADVVLMIEFGPNKRPLIPRMLERYPFHKSCDYDWDCAIALFSRLPMHNIELVEAGEDDGPRRISAEIELGKRVVTIIGTHILSPNHGPQSNFAELDYLANLGRQRGGPMVIAGDLNTTIWAHAFDNFRRKSGLNHMGHLIPTWPASPLPLPQIGIDHMFLSPELRLAEIAAGNAAGSDHLPLIATIALR